MLIFTAAASFWLEIAFKVHVLRRMKRVLLSLLPISLGFLIWDAYAIAQGHWYFDQKQVTGINGPFSIPIEEIDIDENMDAVKKYNIRGVPVLILAEDDGTEIDRMTGMADEKKLLEFIGA